MEKNKNCNVIKKHELLWDNFNKIRPRSVQGKVQILLREFKDDASK